MFFGNLALLLIWWLLTRFFKPLQGAVWYALPIATFWFSLAFWENAFWGMAAVQNIWVVAWAMLTFWKLSRADNYWWWALPMAFMGLFTSGNGLFIMPLALGILLLQKRWKISLIWLVWDAVMRWPLINAVSIENLPDVPSVPTALSSTPVPASTAAPAQVMPMPIVPVSAPLESPRPVPVTPSPVVSPLAHLSPLAQRLGRPIEPSLTQPAVAQPAPPDVSLARVFERLAAAGQQVSAPSGQGFFGRLVKK